MTLVGAIRFQFGVAVLVLVTLQLMLSAQSISAGTEGAGDCKSVAPSIYDVIVVGAGPAGLQGALTLGRALLKTLVIDAGKPRNWMVKEFHNFLGGDGENPAAFRKRQREHIARLYGEYVSFEDDSVVSIEGSVGDFSVTTEKGQQYKARRILLTIGLQEEVPAFPPSYASQYYKSIFQCPFCHGFEVRNKKLAVVAPPMIDYALTISAWSNDVFIFTNGTDLPWLSPETMDRLKRLNITVVEGRIKDLLVSKNEELEAILMEDGTQVKRDAIYHKFKTAQQPLANALKLELDQGSNVKATPPKLETSIPGIYAAGDMIHPMHQIALAVGQGLQAAAFIARDHGMAIESK